MNKNSKRLTAYIIISLLIGGVATALRTAAVLIHLDPSSGYFGDGSLLFAAGLTALVAALFALSFGFAGNKVALSPSFSSPATFVPTGGCAAALIFFSIGLLRKLATMADGLGSYTEVLRTPVGITTLLSAVFACLSVIHFYLNAHLVESYATPRAIASLATILFLSFYTASLYFSTELPINSPNKLVDELALLSAAIFFLYESRISLGREKWRAYCSFGLVSMILTAYSSVPALALFFKNGAMTSALIEENILTFSLFIFITSRLVLTVNLPSKGESAGISAMRASAEARQQTVNEAEALRKDAFAVQMTIDDLLGEVGDSTPEARTPSSEDISAGDGSASTEVDAAEAASEGSISEEDIVSDNTITAETEVPTDTATEAETDEEAADVIDIFSADSAKEANESDKSAERIEMHEEIAIKPTEQRTHTEEKEAFADSNEKPEDGE